ncbi:MOSC domain-containing protein [Georgenia wangjunii]|uniref:MOSC domain-containing protein n=1 Tax=Georgenia wangjunii TaxID=3117730 RepID=UPI002F2602C8
MEGTVVAVHRSPVHNFSKEPVDAIRIVEGVGIEGDAHAGATVKHRSRARRTAEAPNLRQVHLIHEELFDLLRSLGHEVAPGHLGENITTRGIDLLSLPQGTRLTIGDAEVTVTGLRNPCWQIDDFQPGLLKKVVRKNAEGAVERLTGVMATATGSGTVTAGDWVSVDLPAPPHVPLVPV